MYNVTTTQQKPVKFLSRFCVIAKNLERIMFTPEV